MSSAQKESDLVVGIVGVGRLGASAAQRLASRYRLCLFDIESARLEDFRNCALLADGVDALFSQSDVILVSLPSALVTQELLKEVAVGPTRSRILVNLGSADTEAPALYLDRLECAAISCVAAPVSGTAAQAREGTLSMLASGLESAFEAVRPLLSILAAEIFYLGNTFALAHQAKLINNFLSLSNLACASEAAVLGVKGGLDPAQMIEVLNHTLGRSSATETRLPLHVMPGSFDYGRTLALALADLDAFHTLARTAGLAVSPADCAIRSLYREAMERLPEDADVTEVIRPIEQAAGVAVRGRINH